MNTRQYLLSTYRLMLQLYPPTFRRRFASQMLEVAEAAEPAEWPLVFGDTSVAFVRCWIYGIPATAALVQSVINDNDYAWCSSILWRTKLGVRRQRSC